jgi:hypothetical protein
MSLETEKHAQSDPLKDSSKTKLTGTEPKTLFESPLAPPKQKPFFDPLFDFLDEVSCADMDPESRSMFAPREQEKPSIKKKAKQKLGTTLAKPFMAVIAGPLLSRVDKKWMPLITPEIPMNFRETLTEKMKNPKALAVVVSDHYDHANGIEMMFMSKMVLDTVNSDRSPKNQLTRSRLIVAKSIGDGLQDAFLQSILERAEKTHLSKYHLSILTCVTKNDQARRHMEKSENIHFMRELIKIAKAKNEILEIFVEGSVDGGRFTNGKRNGMQPLIEDLDDIFKLLTKNGAELVFVPFGSWGPNRINTKGKHLPTSAALRSLFLEKNPKSLVNIKVGMPITQTEMQLKIQEETGRAATTEDVRNYLGGECIAPLLPLEYQGVFRKK